MFTVANITVASGSYFCADTTAVEQGIVYSGLKIRPFFEPLHVHVLQLYAIALNLASKSPPETFLLPN